MCRAVLFGLVFAQCTPAVAVRSSEAGAMEVRCSLGRVKNTFCVLTQVQEQVFGILDLLLGFKSQSHIQTAWL